MRPDYLSICAIFRDEAENLNEWLGFHHFLGVSKFYLYNDRSTDNFEEVLRPWCEKGLVFLRDAPPFINRKKQQKTYAHCLRRVRGKTKWLAFIDIDEFLWSPTGKKLDRILPRFEAFPGVLVRWELFGSSGHVSRPSGGTLRNFTQCLPISSGISVDDDRARRKNRVKVTGSFYNGKSIFQPAKVWKVGIHMPQWYFGKLVNENLMELDSSDQLEKVKFWSSTTGNLLRINHDWSRSLNELSEKAARSLDGLSRHPYLNVSAEELREEFFARERVLNQQENTGIIPLSSRAELNSPISEG